MTVLIIAEAGVNHNGDMAMAKQLIDTAAEAGADLVKFQTFNADRLVAISAPKAEYQLMTTAADESQHAMLRRLELKHEVHKELVACCQERGIGFFSTGFDIESIDFLRDLGQQRFKIPSGEITNLPYLRHIGRFGSEVILSTGMANLGEVEAAINILEASGTPRDLITVLHCTTAYPTPVNEVNLCAMQSMQQALGVRVGYSDHTQGIEIAVAAAALGATVIEKHFTLDRNLPGPDHKASLEPRELARMVQSIRAVEQALGDGVKRPGKNEQQNLIVVRKSIVAARAIKMGEKFTDSNLTTKRPGTGISPMRWDEVVGATAVKSFDADELIYL